MKIQGYMSPVAPEKKNIKRRSSIMDENLMKI
jgi:hypothetical protein